MNFPNASPDSPSPISSVSSSWTTFTTCWPGVRLLRTASPMARSRTRATKSRTTVKLTSASSSARRISRMAREIDSSSRAPFLRRSPRALCSLSDRLSNTTAHRSRGRSTFFTIGSCPTQPQTAVMTECRIAARAEAGSNCPRSRSVSGTTSAPTAPSRRAGRSCGAPSTSGSRTSISRTTTGRRTGRPRRTSAGPARRPAAVPRRARHLDQGRLRHVAGPVRRVGLAQVPARIARPVAAPDGPRLRRHLLLAPLRSGHAARGDDGRARHGRSPGQGALRRHLVLLARADARGSRDPCRRSARRCSSTSRRTRC